MIDHAKIDGRHDAHAGAGSRSAGSGGSDHRPDQGSTLSRTTPRVRQLADRIITAQEREIAEMQSWLQQGNLP